MIGIFIIIVVVISIVFGIAIHLKTKRLKTEKLNKSENETIIQPSKNKEINQELDNLIKIAVVDGVLTENEKKIIYSKAEELEIDKNIVEEYLNNEIEKTEGFAETRKIDKIKEAGNNFENFIVSKFDKKYFILKEWAGDKYINGIYAETTTNPDLVYCFKCLDVEMHFAVECKYRKEFSNNVLKWAKEHQIKNYVNFQEKNKIPVFVAIGVGGTPELPNDLYLVPLNHLRSSLISKENLEKFKKSNFNEQNIYFNHSYITLT